MNKAEIRSLVKRNPFPHRRTLGLFYGEKMRAIGSILPDVDFANVVEVGGGTSGLTAMLFPRSHVTNVDSDPQVLEWARRGNSSTRVMPGAATDLPIPDSSADCVTMFDVLEHVPDHEGAAREALRVLKPGGYIAISAPSQDWRHPFYRAGLGMLFHSEEEIMAQWGHVRRGYSKRQMQGLFPGCELIASTSYMNPLTVIAHDISFSKLGTRIRIALILSQYPLTLIGYNIGCPGPRMGIALTLRKALGDGD
jgi:SAM-dependent methyltransferase